MTQTCETCRRSWGDRAMFCGACGALLDRSLPSRDGPEDRDGSSWRRPLVAGGLAAAVLVGIVAAVPTLTVERTDPVEDTAIDVPDPDELQDAPPGTRPPRRVDPPDIACSRDEVEVDCVAWSRSLLEPLEEIPNGRHPWPMTVGDHVLLVGDTEVEAVDVATGTRLWRTAVPQESQLTAASAGFVVVSVPGVRVIDLETGATRWSTTAAGHQVHGGIAHDDLVVTGTDIDSAARGIAARDPRDGEVLWTWPSEWSDPYVRRLDRERLMVSSSGEGVAVLDPATGQQRSRVDDLPGGWVLDVVDETIVTLVESDMEPSAPNRAGDRGAVVHGTDLVEGTAVWERDVRSSERWFSVVGDLILAPSSRHLTALDAATGQTAWEVETATSEQPAQMLGPWGPSRGGADHSPPMVVTLDQDHGVVRGRDIASGGVAWERELPGTLWHATVHADAVVLQTSRGVDVLSATTGAHRLHVDGPELQMTGADPLIVFHPLSGYVARLEPPDAPGR